MLFRCSYVDSLVPTRSGRACGVALLALTSTLAVACSDSSSDGDGSHSARSTKDSDGGAAGGSSAGGGFADSGSSGNSTGGGTSASGEALPLSANRLLTSHVQGDAPGDELVVYVDASGGGWTATPTEDWVKISGTSDELPAMLTVRADSGDLDVGLHETVVVVASDDGATAEILVQAQVFPDAGFGTGRVAASSDTVQVQQALAGDFDGDGDQDVAALTESGTLVWYENEDRTGRFAGARVVARGLKVRALHVADLNGDELDDLVLHGETSVWFEREQGDWSEPHFWAPHRPFEVTFDDFDDDGDDDIIMLWSTHAVWALRVDDGGRDVTRVQVIDDDVSARGVTVADLDGDGLRDVIVNVGSSFYWYPLQGDGQYGSRRQVELNLGPAAPVTGDYDRDGDVDFLVSEGGRILLNEGDGTEFLERYLPGSTQRGARFMDTGGSTLAVVQAAFEVGAGTLISDRVGTENREPLTWQGPGVLDDEHEEIELEYSPSPYTSVELADLDGDADLDVLVASAGTDRVSWLENLDDAGGFAPSKDLGPAMAGVHRVEVFDANGDGSADVTSLSLLSGALLVHEARTDGSFRLGQTVANRIEHPWLMQTEDIQDDGSLELIYAETNRIHWQSIGAGGLEEVNTIVTDENPAVYATFRDANGDGLNDLIFSTKGPYIGNFPNRVVVCFNAEPLWTFPCDLPNRDERDNSGWLSGVWQVADLQALLAREPVTFGAIDADPDLLELGDVDGDGTPDAIAAFPDAQRLVWYRGVPNGEGFEHPGEELERLVDVRAIAVGDLDADGDGDIVAATFFPDDPFWQPNEEDEGDEEVPREDFELTSGLAWYENTGDGFVRHLLPAYTGDFAGLTLRDLDQDGTVDIVLANSRGSQVMWFPSHVAR